MEESSNSYSFKSITKNKLAFIVIFLIAFIYLFPFLSGKVDTPVDVRDVLMYPWRHYAVDKKIDKVILWFPEKKTYLLQVFPSITSNQVFGININNKFVKNNNSNFYLTFDFKIYGDSDSKLDFGINFVNKLNNKSYIPGYAVTPILKDGEKQTSWYKAYLNINSIIDDISSINELNNFEVVLVAKTHSKKNPLYLNIKEMELAAEDFSKVKKVHNFYLNDLIQVFTPFREYYSSSIKKSRFPFWNNYIFTGTEFLSEPQLGYFHPVYFLCYFLFDHFTAHGLVTFISLVLSGIGAFLLARYWNLGYAASLFTAIVYMFHPFNVTWFSYEHMLMNSAVMPFLLLFYEKNLAQSKLLNKYLLICGLLLGLIFLSGHLQYIYYTFIFFLLFALFKFVEVVGAGFPTRGGSAFGGKPALTKPAFTRHLFSIVFISGIGVMIGAVVLVPFFPLLSNSHRVANTKEFISANSFPLKAFLGLIFPFYGGCLEGSHSESLNLDPKYVGGFFNNYIYFGILPFVFFLLSLWTLATRKITIFFIFVIIFSFLVCTGSPVYFLLRDILPGFKQMQHYRFLQLYSYSVPFLAGIGFQLFCNKVSFLKDNFKSLLISFVILVTVFDLIHFSSFFITWSDRKDYKPLQENGSLKFLTDKIKQSKEPFRVLPFAIDKIGETKLKVNIAQPNTLFPYGIEDVSGYSSFIPKDIFNLFVYVQTKDPNKLYKKEMLNLFTNPNIPFPIYNFKSKILDLLNVKYFIVPSVITIEPEYATKVFDGDCAVYENKDVLPRAFLVENYKVIKEPKDVILELDNPVFNPKEEVILNTDIQQDLQIANPPGPKRNLEAKRTWSVGMVVSEKNVSPAIIDTPNKITIHTKIPKPGFLVLGNNLNDNWKVKINGRNSEHFQVNLVQRAVYLPEAGDYLIEFYYYPKLFLVGGVITCFAFLLLGLMALLLNKRVQVK